MRDSRLGNRITGRLDLRDLLAKDCRSKRRQRGFPPALRKKVFYLEEEGKVKEGKRMSHLQNIVGAIEDKGYAVLSIQYDENSRLDIVVENPGYAGNRAFLEKARDQEGRAS
jgi:hypothetical protein